MTHRQLLAAGRTPAEIKSRLENGRLHRVHRGVYAVGRPELTHLGIWMTAVLAAGPGALLSHFDAAALWRIFGCAPSTRIELSVPNTTKRRRPGLKLHRRQATLIANQRHRQHIPLTGPAATIIDIATRLTRAQLIAAINEADANDLATPRHVRAEAAANPKRRGATLVADLIDRETLHLTRSELERLFIPLARRAGLGEPQTDVWVNGFRVDFHFPDLGLIVETDGGTFHRTPFQQTRDRQREHAHLRAGMTPVRFTHAQVAYDPDDVVGLLIGLASRLR